MTVETVMHAAVLLVSGILGCVVALVIARENKRWP